MLETRTADEYVEFHAAGTPGKGQYRCAECRYGITITDELPTCPMCGGTSWEASAWSPFANARSNARPGRGDTLLL